MIPFFSFTEKGGGEFREGVYCLPVQRRKGWASGVWSTAGHFGSLRRPGSAAELSFLPQRASQWWVDAGVGAWELDCRVPESLSSLTVGRAPSLVPVLGPACSLSQQLSPQGLTPEQRQQPESREGAGPTVHLNSELRPATAGGFRWSWSQ